MRLARRLPSSACHFYRVGPPFPSLSLYPHSVIASEAHSDMGVANGGVVYALFSREATETGELGLCEGERLLVRERSGEEWWEVEGEDGERGLVPGTFLGSTPRYQVIP